MIDTLPLFHRIHGCPVVVTGDGEAAAAKRRLVERAGGRVVTDLEAGIVAGARLAFVAQDEEGAAQADVARARQAGLLVNATDRPALCDFTVPSILDRAPVLVAVGTGGASAGLAKQLRLRLEALLPASLGALAQALAGAREALRGQFPDAADRRRALDAALAAGGALDPFDAGSAQRVDAWLSDPGHAAAHVVEIVLRSDDPDDLTLREARLLGTADLIAHEPRIATTVLDRARADARRVEIDVAATAPPTDGTTVILRGPR